MILCDAEEDLLHAAALIQGSLTASIFCAAFDAAIVARLQPILEQRVGRLIYNGVPTGVEVCESMVHGGPFPATNQPHTTAVGPMAIERWCRPVCYQNAPDLTLPPELKNENPYAIERMVNGVVTKAGV
jgi:NADP-dependent aldehyde dehydrogenase